VVGNKIQGAEDLAFLREHAGCALLACFGHEPAVRAMEQGRPFSLGDLGQDAQAALAALRQAADARAKDWAKLTRQATEFHLRNATAWASAAAGEDLAGQVDRGFMMGPQALLVAGGDQVTGPILA
jgi:CO dehydrogenase maturation factor